VTDTVDLLPSMAGDILATVRDEQPHVHCLTNIVAANISANVLLAVGARPSMTDTPGEIKAFVASTDALLVNLGMLTNDRRESILLAVETMAERNMPWVLDPVKIGTSPTRRKFAENLLLGRPAALKANRSEFSVLTAAPSETVTACTGPVDRIEGGGQFVTISNGHELADRVTAMGCAEGALIAAFLAVHPDRFTATASAILVFNVAAEIAAETAKGPGSFQSNLLDSLYSLDTQTIASRARLERIQKS